jgi:hypothetical protein
MIGIVRIGCVCLAGTALLFAGCIAPTTTTGTGTTGSGSTGGSGSGLGGNDAGAGTSSGGNDAGGSPGPSGNATCNFSFTNTTCEACFQANCTQACDACSGDTACSNAVDCLSKCNGDSACESACTTNLSSASNQRLMAMLGKNGCIATSCSVACGTAGGIGDPCTQGSDCASGLCANGGSGNGWCSRTCTQNTDCASTSSSITDREGELVWCMATSGGQKACFPGCSSSSQCTSWYGVGSCVTGTAVNGATASVCSN